MKHQEAAQMLFASLLALFKEVKLSRLMPSKSVT